MLRNTVLFFEPNCPSTDENWPPEATVARTLGTPLLFSVPYSFLLRILLAFTNPSNIFLAQKRFGENHCPRANEKSCSTDQECRA